MKKHITILMLGLLAYTGYAQEKTGVNTTSPEATLDIVSTTANTTTDVEGILIPRVSKEKAFKMSGTVEATEIYVNDLSTAFTFPTDGTEAKVAKITENGFYFWNGTEWVKKSSKNGQEWMYDAGNKQIDLVRSGTTPFVNKVYYDEKNGNYRNYDVEQYEVWNGQSYETRPMQDLTDANLIFRESNAIEAREHTDISGVSSLNKTLSSQIFQVNDDTNVSNKAQNMTSFNGRLFVKKDNPVNYNFLKGISSSADHYGTGDAKYLVGGSFHSSIKNGSSSGYVQAVRSGLSLLTPNSVKMGAGYASYIGVGSPTEDVHTLYGHIAYTNGTPTVENSFNIRLNQNVYTGITANITNAAGLYYDGFYTSASGGNGTLNLTNNYGILLGDIDEGQNNYAIYTNAGDIRFGDLTGTGDRIVTADANGVLKTGTTTVAQATSKWTNDAANSVVKLTNLSDGTTARTDDKNIFIEDDGDVGIGINPAIGDRPVGTKFVTYTNTVGKQMARFIADNSDGQAMDDFVLESYSNAKENAALFFANARGTMASPKTLQDGDHQIYITGVYKTNIVNSNNNYQDGTILLGRYRGDGSNRLHDFSINNMGVYSLYIDVNDNIGIGTGAPTEKLHVIGNILASGTITPDYVFEKYYEGESTLKADYEMMNLSEVEAFTKEHKHLPGVPSAKEVEEKGGVLVNRATEINLEKIEELYLHTIEQEKKIDKQNSKIEAQQKEIEKLKAQNREIEELKTLVKQLLNK